MFSVFDRIAEQRIQEAIGRGELDNLPCAGKPLDLDDDRMVPTEIEVRRDIAALIEALLRLDGGERSAALRKLELLRLRLSESRRGPLSVADSDTDQLLDRLSGSGSASSTG
ncbi:DUF1992 domain-containing protein [Chitinivorax sp. PXF-14]|uniref:DnaJ family domain-containing protein n=1 Tax=Chitinivorax sp. PXF-14 TaxID=3230488 RepID=UPI0034659919